MAKYKCEWCGKKVTADKAYRITRYDMAYAAENGKLPVQTICEDCIKSIGQGESDGNREEIVVG